MQTFINKHIGDEFDKYGVYLQPQFLSNDEIAYLMGEFTKLTTNADINRGFFTSTDLKSSEKRIAIRDLINTVVNQKKIDAIVKGYTQFYSNLLFKKPETNSEMILHTDWSITDEALYSPLQLWIPLVDVNKINGALSVLLGSHKLTHTYRGRGVGEYYMNYQPVLMEHLTYFEVKKGDALFYHPGIMHYSPPNLSNTTRLAILVSLYPTAMQPVLYFSVKGLFGSKINMYQLPLNFFDDWDKKSKPDLPVIKQVKNSTEKLSMASFTSKIVKTNG